MYVLLVSMWFGAVLLIMSLYRESKKDEMMRAYRKDIADIGREIYETEVIEINSYRQRMRRAG